MRERRERKRERGERGKRGERERERGRIGVRDKVTVKVFMKVNR